VAALIVAGLSMDKIATRKGAVMSTITDLTPVLRTTSPSFSGSGNAPGQKNNSTETSTNTQTTGGAGLSPHASPTNQTEQAQSSVGTTAAERSSKTVGLAPPNADAESVVLSTAFETRDLLSEALDTAVAEARELNAAAMDRLRLDQLISGLAEARQAFDQQLKSPQSRNATAGDPMAMISPAEKGEAIRLGGSPY